MISEVVRDQAIKLIVADALATTGEAHEEEIRTRAEDHRDWFDDPYEYMDRVVEDVQADFHDHFVDTTWPACPIHPRHPMWFWSGWWRCEESNKKIAELGCLGSAPGGAA